MPHRSGRRREHSSIVLAGVAMISGMNKMSAISLAASLRIYAVDL
jgi:hypothetical protein